MTRRETPRPTDTYTAQRGIVSRVVLTISGPQPARITTLATGTRAEALTIELPDLVMQFTAAAQVQHLRGFLAFAATASMGMVPEHPLTAPISQRFSATMRSTITWTGLPSATVTRELMGGGTVATTLPYVALQYDPMVLRILDLAALESLGETLAAAHRTAVGAFTDGPTHRADPTKVDWRPDNYHDFVLRDHAKRQYRR